MTSVSVGLSGSGLFETLCGNLELPCYKSEIPNPKFETIPNDPKHNNSKHSGARTKLSTDLFWVYLAVRLFRISCFGFRILSRNSLCLWHDKSKRLRPGTGNNK